MVASITYCFVFHSMWRASEELNDVCKESVTAQHSSKNISTNEGYQKKIKK